MVEKINENELMVEIPATVKLYKNIKTGKIIGEIHVDGDMLYDFNIAEIASDWREFFIKKLMDPLAFFTLTSDEIDAQETFKGG